MEGGGSPAANRTGTERERTLAQRRGQRRRRRSGTAVRAVGRGRSAGAEGLGTCGEGDLGRRRGSSEAPALEELAAARAVRQTG